MVMSNTITIHVKSKTPEKPEIIDVKLTTNKTEVYERETISFEYIIYLNKTITNETARKYRVKITVLVNNMEHKSFYESLVPGTDYINGDFELAFIREGEYAVSIDAEITT